MCRIVPARDVRVHLNWRGWNHHVTLALCCYAFVVAEQLRHFSLTTLGARWDDPLAPAA